MERNITEQWIGQVAFLAVWVPLFGGGPAYIALSQPSTPWFLWLFPVVAVGVAGGVVWRILRSGFVVSSEGLSGTHELGDETLSWENVSAFEWEAAARSSNSNGSTSRPTYHLMAVTSHGAVRVTSIAANSRGCRRLMQALSNARDEGSIPKDVELHRPLTAGEMFRTLGSTLLGGGDANDEADDQQNEGDRA